MARRAALSFGSLNPFGGGDLSFGAFNVAPKAAAPGSAVIDPSKEAYLEFQKVETEYQAGRVDDGTYQAAFQAYSGSLEAGTSEAYNAQARLESMQYSMARDEVLTRVQSGQASWGELVSFDQQSLAGLNPGSQEYRDREGRMWASQVNEFNVAEQQISDDLAAERMTFTQALGWYESARGLYGSNYGLTEAIDNTIKQVKVRIVQEVDQEVLNQWKGGTLGLDQLLGYAAKVQAEDPNSVRSRTWADNAKVATDQAVETSLTYRYGLTEEYRDLELLVASAKAPTGNTSISKSIQYVYTAGGWVAKTVSKSTYHAPTPTEQQAYKELQVKVAVARKRMGEINKLVGTMPGGWVTEDDIIRKIAEGQALMVKGSPAWIEAQTKIDSYNERKRSDEILRKSGVVINLPTVASEKAQASDVGSSERPFAPSVGGAKVPLPPKAAASGGGGGGGGTAKAGLPGPKNDPKAAPGGFLFQALGPANSKSKNVVTVTDVGGQKVTISYKATGLPVGMNSVDFKALYAGMTGAVRDGETFWTNPATGIGYVLPPDPSDRLAIMSGLDSQNIEQRLLEYKTNPNKTTAKAYGTALGKANTNTLHVMDDPYAGLPIKVPDFVKKLVDSVIDPYLLADRKAAPIAAALDYMDRTKTQLTSLGEKAQEAFDSGDVEQAYRYLNSANSVIGGADGPLAKASMWATVAETGVQTLVASGADLPKSGTLATNIATVRSLGSSDPDVAWLGQVMNTSGLEEIASFFDPKKALAKGTQSPYKTNPATGQPIVGADGAFVMNEGWVRVLSGGKLVAKQTPMAPNDANRMVPTDPSKVMVRLQVGDSFRDVAVDFTVGRIGSAVMADGTKSAIDGKKIDVMWDGKRYQMAQDPLNPTRWVPLSDRGLTFNLPAGAKVINGSSTLGKTGSQIMFTVGSEGATGMRPGQPGGGKKGTTYVLGQESDGTYTLNSTDAAGIFTGEKIPAGDERALGIINASGIRLDTSSMGSDQRSYLNTGLNGIYLGDPNRILLEGVQARTYLQSLSPGGVQNGGSNFLLPSASNFFPRPNPAATPVQISKMTPSPTSPGGTIPRPYDDPYVAPSSLTYSRPTATPVISPTTGFVLSGTPILAPTPSATAAQISKMTPSPTSTGTTPKAAPKPAATPAQISKMTPSPTSTGTTPKITPPPVNPALEKLRLTTGGGR